MSLSPGDKHQLTAPPQVGGAHTGIEGLDEILAGGLPHHRLFLVEGDPGVGKTTLGLQFVLAGRDAGEPALYISLSESLEDLEQIATSHGWSLHGVHVYEHRPPSILHEDSDQTVFHPAEVELRETMAALLEEVERLNPTRVVIDSLSELRLLSQESLRYRRQLFALKNYFSGRACTCLLLDEVPRAGMDIHVQSIAHGVMRMEELAPEFGSNRRRLRVVKIRGRHFRGGFHDYSITRGGLEVFPRLVAAEHRPSVADELISSGIKELDQMLGGGIDRGTATLILGPPGAGKSTVALQCAVTACRRGEKVSMFIFDETTHLLFKRGRGLGLACEDYVDDGTLSVQHVGPAELSPGEFAHRVCRAVRDGARLIVIDSLNGYFNAMTQERLIALHMHELLTYLSDRGICTLMVGAQRGLVRTVEMPALEISYLADTVLLLRFFEAVGQMRQLISVFKRRSGGHDHSLRELRLVTGKGVVIGRTLNEFRGVLSGSPIYDRDAVMEVEEML